MRSYGLLLLWVVEEPPAKADSWAQNSAPSGWDDARTAGDAPWEAPVEAEPQKPARESAPSAPIGVGADV